jgi:hypothetical protein
MWRYTVAILIILSAAVNDPMRVHRLLEPSLQALGATLRSALDVSPFLSLGSGERRR